MSWFEQLWRALTKDWNGPLDPEMQYLPLKPKIAPLPPITPPNPIPMPPPSIDTLLPWNTTSSLSHENWHNVRVLCDLEGLSHAQKDELCATVWGESEFNTHATCINYGHHQDGTKYVASTDHGICQWNDYYHASEITPEQAIDDPEKAIRLMCQYFKAGRQSQWVAYSSNRYKQFLGRTL